MWWSTADHGTRADWPELPAGFHRNGVRHMAKNTGKGYRHGEVRDRSQILNPVTKLWEKRNDDTGEIMDVKQVGEPFKGVRREKP